MCRSTSRIAAAKCLRLPSSKDERADIHTVALILGHKDLRMAARYQHLSPAFLSDAVKLLDSAFAEEPKDADGSKEGKDESKQEEKPKTIAASAEAGKG
jgi:hypothetical protein